MKKENIVELVRCPEICHDERPENSVETGTYMSDELQQAIQSLIYRMRELGPLQTA
jgi:hypothetical protein